MPTALELLGDPAHGLVRELRAPQLQMATSVQEVLDQGGVYVVEGPVGVGKTLSYLTPTLMAAGRRAVIATAKKSLQDQIENKDIPAIARVLGVVDGQAHELTTGPAGERFYLSRTIKGKSNYACRLLAEKNNPTAEYLNWLNTSKYGDRADYPGATPPWFSSATAEECVGRACKNFSTCGYTRLKQEVQQSRVAVVNHHLLGSDMYYGLGKLVGGPYDVLVIDEAHKLADGIRAAYTLRVTTHAIADLEKQLALTDLLFSKHRELIPLWGEMFGSVPDTHWRETHLREAPVFPAGSDDALAGLKAVDQELAGVLKMYGITGNPSESAFWEDFARVLEEEGDDKTKSDLMIAAMSRRRINGLSDGINIMQGHAVKQQDEEDDFAYMERNQRMLANTVIYGQADRQGRFSVSAAPINVGGIAHSYLSQVKSVIVTSATLAVDDEFDHLTHVIGVKPTKTEILPTSFDFAKQGFCFIPKDTPVLKRLDPQYGYAMRRRIDYCEELVNLSQGGTFILTTANDELDAIAEALITRVKYPVFVQGHSKNPWHGDPQAVLRKYMANPNSVLIGSKSFWEGVDVQGEQLRQVIITKLPFPNPQDPFIIARTQRYEDSREGWRRVSYVDMMIDLRQGIGRLIRAKTDRGMVALLDSRVWEKEYGRRIRRALQFPITHRIEDCRQALPRIVAYFQRGQHAT